MIRLRVALVAAAFAVLSACSCGTGDGPDASVDGSADGSVGDGGRPALNHSESYEYDEAGRLTRVTYGSGATVTYLYDRAGNVLRRTITTP